MHACVTYIILILYNIKKEKRKKKKGYLYLNWKNGYRILKFCEFNESNNDVGLIA